MQPASKIAWGLVSLVVYLAACSAAGKKASDTASAAARPAPSATTATAAPEAALPGALAKPLDQYTAPELRALTRRLVFTGGVERNRRCKGAAACSASGAFTRLRVDAVEGEDSISAGAVPANGVIAARVLNRGTYSDALYGTSAGGGLEYYLVVMKGAKAGTAIWRLEQIGLSAKQLTHRTVATGIFRECHHPYARGARADFKTCEEAALIHNTAFTMPQTTDSPIWIGCATGCCTADPGGT